MSLPMVLERLKARPGFRQCVTAWRRLPPRSARYADFPSGISPVLIQALASRGTKRLYTHQAAAIREILAGRPVIITTPTASGKTLCYNLPVLNAILQDATARALYLFPTKALAQDQRHELSELGAALRADIRVHTYDGDTAVADRQAIRRANHIIISNPDMVHTGILPHHTRWAAFFQGLRYVVIDEVHYYRGVLGSHLANVIRRLKRICRFYGSSPQFICCSATIANAGELAAKLLEEKAVVIEESGAPAGEKHMIFYNPPLLNKELGIRRSAVFDARALGREFIEAGVQTIIFARSRPTTEILLRYLQTDVHRHDMAEQIVRGYRGGYLPGERREVERGLREGEVRAVVATNALELGIDIGQLDACIMTGYPGTIASTWQQAGRAGRRREISVAILIASASPLDQYLVTHPDYFFSRSPEHVLINPDNLIILANHIRCAAFELPFQKGESFGNLGAEETAEILDFLCDEQVLHRVGETWHWMSEAYPAAAISLRTADPDSFVIMDMENGNQVIGQVDCFAAPMLIHEGAIYLHQGVSYQVERLDWEGRQALVRPTDVGYYTEANRVEKVNVLEVLEEEKLNGCDRARGEVVVTSVATTYRKVRFYTQEVLGWGEIHLPEQEMHTTAYWLSLSEEVPSELEPLDRGPNWATQRRLARERDHYTCQVCGATEESLNREHDVHHIKPFKEFGYIPGVNENYMEANALDNLITLCRSCHSRVSGDRLSKDAFSNGLRGLAHLLHNVAPLYLMCEPQNLGVLSELRSAWNGKPTIYLYDSVPAGVGFSEALYRLHHELVERAYELVMHCPCAEGCPSCVGPAAAEGEGGKGATIYLLERLRANGTQTERRDANDRAAKDDSP